MAAQRKTPPAVVGMENRLVAGLAKARLPSRRRKLLGELQFFELYRGGGGKHVVETVLGETLFAAKEIDVDERGEWVHLVRTLAWKGPAIAASVWKTLLARGKQAANRPRLAAILADALEPPAATQAYVEYAWKDPLPLGDGLMSARATIVAWLDAAIAARDGEQTRSWLRVLARMPERASERAETVARAEAAVADGVLPIVPTVLVAKTPLTRALCDAPPSALRGYLGYPTNIVAMDRAREALEKLSDDAVRAEAPRWDADVKAAFAVLAKVCQREALRDLGTARTTARPPKRLPRDVAGALALRTQLDVADDVKLGAPLAARSLAAVPKPLRELYANCDGLQAWDATIVPAAKLRDLGRRLVDSIAEHVADFEDDAPRAAEDIRRRSAPAKLVAFGHTSSGDLFFLDPLKTADVIWCFHHDQLLTCKRVATSLGALLAGWAVAAWSRK